MLNCKLKNSFFITKRHLYPIKYFTECSYCNFKLLPILVKLTKDSRGIYLFDTNEEIRLYTTTYCRELNCFVVGVCVKEPTFNLSFNLLIYRKRHNYKDYDMFMIDYSDKYDSLYKKLWHYKVIYVENLADIVKKLRE